MNPTGRRKPAQEQFVLGLMSGTSCDGVDAALAGIRGHGLNMRVRLLAHVHQAYPSRLRRRLLEVMCPSATTTGEIVRLHADVGRFFGHAGRKVIETWNDGRPPDLAGSHGQTIGHLPHLASGAATLQIGEPAYIAAALGCPVVADFRQADVAVGGQGAPLVPWTDFVLFRHPRIARAVQNIGGISNVTYLPPGDDPDEVIAFDTGPGNMIIDELMRRITHGRQSLDRNGEVAARGRVLEPVLARWLRGPFFARRPPKSAGREDFGQGFVKHELPRLRAASSRAEDWIATATAFTARSIADAYRRFLPRRHGRPAVNEIIVCGGGAANAALRNMLASELAGIPIRTIDEFGIPSLAKEALSFAMLAAAHMHGVPANLPHVTGASCPVILGKLCQPPKRDR